MIQIYLWYREQIPVRCNMSGSSPEYVMLESCSIYCFNPVLSTFGVLFYALDF
jgi:hypothetical protein